MDKRRTKGGASRSRAGRNLLGQAQELIYNAWETADRKRRVALAQRAVSICPDCADAYVRLPDQFRDLETLASIWSLSTEAERHAKRLASSITELRTLYDALMPRIDDVLAYLSEFQLENLTPEGHNLFHLACSLAEIGPAVELYGQPEVPDGYDSRRFIPAAGQ